jgi:hypothetical protein
MREASGFRIFLEGKARQNRHTPEDGYTEWRPRHRPRWGALVYDIRSGLAPQTFNIFKKADHAHRRNGNIYLRRSDAVHELVPDVRKLGQDSK